MYTPKKKNTAGKKLPSACPESPLTFLTENLKTHLIAHTGENWTAVISPFSPQDTHRQAGWSREYPYKCNYLNTTKAAMGVGTPYVLSLWRKTERLHTMQFCNSTKKSTGISHAHSHGRKSIQVHKMKLFNKNKTSTEISPALGCLCFLIWMFFLEKVQRGGKGGGHLQCKKIQIYKRKKAQ